jgi:hypothetical protein
VFSTQVLSEKLHGLGGDLETFYTPEVVEERTSPEDLEAIELQVKRFCVASVARVKEEEDDWALLHQLHENEIGPNEWALGTRGLRMLDPSQTRVGSFQDDQRAPWYSNTLYSPSHLIDMVLANVYGALFDGPDYLTVTCDSNTDLSDPVTAFQNTLAATPPPTQEFFPGQPMGPEQMAMMPPAPPAEDMTYPLAIRVQELLKSYLNKGQFHARIADAIKDWALLGTLPLKVSWHELTTLGPPDESGFRERIILESHPVLHPIPLNNFLPDPSALTNNTQEWRMVGHRVSRSFDEIMDGFNTGRFHLNQDEFEEKWSPEGGGSRSEPDSITGESNEGDKDDLITRLWLWELHGQFATSDGFIEGSVTLVSSDKEDPWDALLVRYVDHPVLEIGKRPIVVGHFSPRRGPFGKGLIHCSKDLIYSISQLICQLQDNAKLTAIGMWQCPEGSSQFEYLKANGGMPFPGMVAPYDPVLGDKLEAVNMPIFNAQVLFELLSFLIGILERRTVTETYQGQSGKRQTATEAAITQQQSQRPVVFRQDLLARTVLEPALNLCLSLVCSQAIGDEQIMFAGTDGTPVPATITQEELRQNKFTVQLTMTRADHTRIAKAQSLERILPMLRELGPVLGQEGYQLAMAEIVKRYFDCLGIDGVDRILKQLTPQERQMQAIQQQIMMMQAQGGQPPQGPPNLSVVPGGQGAPQPPEMGAEGGPMGSGSDADVMAQQLQNMALQNAGLGI